MKKPWQIWSTYLLCLAAVLPAMGWLTQRALLLDGAEARVQQQADLEETVGSLLWQMDAELTQLLAPEIARPAMFFRSFVSGDSAAGAETKPMPSPLLKQPSDYVLLHFEIGADDTWHSPQCPPEPLVPLAIANDVSRDKLAVSNLRLSELSQQVCYADLLKNLPTQMLPVEHLPVQNWANNTAFADPSPQQPPSQFVKNTLSFDEIQQQLAANQAEPPQQQAYENQSGLLSGGYGEARNRRQQSLRNSDLQKRDAALQSAAQQAIVDQRFNALNLPAATVAAEGISQPLWVGDHLLLARRVDYAGEIRIQGCWLDWPNIRRQLLARADPLLPQADLQPVHDLRDVRLSRVLATVPVQLVVPEPAIAIHWSSPIRVSLLVAWVFLILAAAAVAGVLQAVVALSERRAAFVSAVTHELRTPLTTFRMYAEMLSLGMIPGEEQRREYLRTLHVEAERLSHLVENVLNYARLERGATPRRRERVSGSELLERIRPRLVERAERGEMLLDFDLPDAAANASLETDPAAVEQILFNLVDNACKYAGNSTDRRIHVSAAVQRRRLAIAVQDHGPGISPRESRRLFRPFSKTANEAALSAPGVGLGLALSRRLAAELGGRLEIRRRDAGAEFVLTLRLV